MCCRTLRPLSRHLGFYLTYGVPQVKRPYRIGGHPVVIWMWCLSPMDDRDGGPLRADVSLSRFPAARIYIVCVLASRLLSWVRMFSGLGILIAPRSSTFRVNLSGYFSLHFFIPREEVLISNALNSCGFVFCRRVLTTILFSTGW